ncbi:MAG: flagellar assembly protein FliW [Verrucomicrobiia bacterium]
MASTLLEAKTVARSTAPHDSHIIHFPSGLLGFEQLKEFALIGRPREAPFLWLEGQDDSKVAFIVVPTTQVVPDYRPDLSDADVEFLGLNSPKDALVLSIVTLRGHGRATINLKGPLVINARTCVGKQVVPSNASEYSARHSLSVTA